VRRSREVSAGTLVPFRLRNGENVFRSEILMAVRPPEWERSAWASDQAPRISASTLKPRPLLTAPVGRDVAVQLGACIFQSHSGALSVFGGSVEVLTLAPLQPCGGVEKDLEARAVTLF
jgi:hypothetical protein